VTPAPEIRGAWQNAFCEGEDALHVEFFELTRVTVDPRERQLLAQLLGVTVVRLDLDQAFEEERFVETVELFLDGFGRSLGGCDLFANGGLARLPDPQHRFLY
jgi:hypothetical protein